MIDFVNGDFFDEVRKIPDNYVDLWFTSPEFPGQYGNNMTVEEWEDFLTDAFYEALLKTKENGIIAFECRFKRDKNGFVSTAQEEAVSAVLLRSGLSLAHRYLWVKPNANPCGCLEDSDYPGYSFVYVATPAFNIKDITFNPIYKEYAEKTKAKSRSGKMRGDKRFSGGHSNLSSLGARTSDVLIIPQSSGNMSKRPYCDKNISFPVELAEAIILRFTNPGDVVGDMFAGVGTTLFAAQKNNRMGWGTEIEKTEWERGMDWLAGRWGQPKEQPFLI